MRTLILMGVELSKVLLIALQSPAWGGAGRRVE